MTKCNELLCALKDAEVQAKDKKCCKMITTIMAVVGIVVVVAGVAFAVYKFITRNKEEENLWDDIDEEDSFVELELVYPEEDNAQQTEVQTEEEE